MIITEKSKFSLCLFVGISSWKPPFLTRYVPLLPVRVFNKDTFPTFYANGPLFHRSIYTSCTARPNQGPSNWVVKGAAGGDVRFITRYAQKSMHPLKWLSLYGPSGKYEWKWRSGRAFMWYEWGPPFRVLPHGSKQTSSRRVPLVLNSPCSQSIVCSHARFRTWLLDIKSPKKRVNKVKPQSKCFSEHFPPRPCDYNQIKIILDHCSGWKVDSEWPKPWSKEEGVRTQAQSFVWQTYCQHNL